MIGENKRTFDDMEVREKASYVLEFSAAVKDAKAAADRLAEKYRLDELTARAALAKIIGDEALEKIKERTK